MAPKTQEAELIETSRPEWLENHPILDTQIHERGEPIVITPLKKLEQEHFENIRKVLGDAPGDAFKLDFSHDENLYTYDWDETKVLTTLRLAEEIQMRRTRERDREDLELSRDEKRRVQNLRARGIETGYDEASAVISLSNKVEGFDKQQGVIRTINTLEATLHSLTNVLEASDIQPEAVEQFENHINMVIVKAASDRMMKTYGNIDADKKLWMDTDKLGNDLFENATGIVKVMYSSPKKEGIEKQEEERIKLQAKLMQGMLEIFMDSGKGVGTSDSMKHTFDQRASDIARNLMGENINPQVQEKSLIELNRQDLLERQPGHQRFTFSPVHNELSVGRIVSKGGDIGTDIGDIGIDVFAWNLRQTMYKQIETGTFRGESQFVKRFDVLVDRITKPKSPELDRVMDVMDMMTIIKENHNSSESTQLSNAPELISQRDCTRLTMAILTEQLGSIASPEYPQAIDIPLHATVEQGQNSADRQSYPELAFSEAIRNLKTYLDEGFSDASGKTWMEPNYRLRLSAAVVYAAKTLHTCDKRDISPIPDITLPEKKKK